MTHPSVTSLLRWFEFTHLPDDLAQVSKPFHDLAVHLASSHVHGPELAVALRKLLESKDAAVRNQVQYRREEQ